MINTEINSGNGELDNGKVRERELQEAAKTLERETGITSSLLMTIAENPVLRRIFYIVAIGVGLMVGSALLEGDQKMEGDEHRYEQIDPQLEARLRNSLLTLVLKLRDQGLIKDSSQEGQGYPGWYFGNMGRYEIEFANRDLDNNLDEDDRIGVRYKDEKGVSYRVKVRGSEVQGIAISESNPQEFGFEAMTTKELAEKTDIVAGGRNDQIIYVKFLSSSEVQKMVDNINLEAVKVSLSGAK